MLRLSSNWTLILKVAVPVVYLSFFGIFILAVLFLESNLPLLENSIFRISIILIYALFVILFYFTLFRLRRVEYSDSLLYVSNYFKNYRYSLADVTSMLEYDFYILTIVKVKLAQKGNWGDSLYFMAKTTNLNTFKAHHPQFFASI